MAGINISCQVLSGGQSSKVAVTTTSAQSAALTATSYLITSDVNIFVRMGENPIALSDGTDQIMLANNTYRIVPAILGQKFAFISLSGAGNVYLTPNA